MKTTTKRYIVEILEDTDGDLEIYINHRKKKMDIIEIEGKDTEDSISLRFTEVKQP